MLTCLHFCQYTNTNLISNLIKPEHIFSLTKLKIERLYIQKQPQPPYFGGTFLHFVMFHCCLNLFFDTKDVSIILRRVLAQGSEFVFCLVFYIHDQSLNSLLHQVIFDFWYNGKNWWLYLFWREGFLSTSSGSWW